MPIRLTNANICWTAYVCALAACSGVDPAGEARVADTAAALSKPGPVTDGHLAAGSGAAATGRGAGLAAAAPEVSLVGDSRYVGPFTSRTGQKAFDQELKIIGTDLGISFPYAGKLYFLFGDSWLADTSSPEQGLDALASTPLAPPAPGDVPALSWERHEGGPFKPFTIDKFGPLKEMSVPVEAVPVGEELYVFYFSSAKRETDAENLFGAYPNRSVLTRANKSDLTNLTWVHDREQTNFKSVSVVQDNGMLYIFGAGAYRQSPVHLARVAPAQLSERDSWEYYKVGGRWELTEDAELEPLTGTDPDPDAPCVGEISVRKYNSLYFMTYNCGPQGKIEHYIQLRVAQQPEGPWSKPQTLLRYDQGYGVFIHADPAQTGMDDQLGEPGLFDDWQKTPRVQGDVYGPYLIPEWFSEPQPGQYEIAYTISSWNPYQVHLMRSTVTVTAAQ